jgi:hypothetical protein
MLGAFCERSPRAELSGKQDQDEVERRTAKEASMAESLISNPKIIPK